MLGAFLWEIAHGRDFHPYAQLGAIAGQSFLVATLWYRRTHVKESSMLIAEQLLLIALDPRTGRIPLGTKSYLKVGLAGALLAELALDGHLELNAGRVRVTPTSVHPPADPLLAELLAGVPLDESMKPKVAVKRVERLVGGSWNRLIDRLADTGVLGRDNGSALSTTRHPVLDAATGSAVVAAARRSATSDDPLEPRQAVVLAFAGPCRLLERVAPERADRRHAKARIAQATELAPFGPTVKAIIDELIATTAAVTVVIASS